MCCTRHRRYSLLRRRTQKGTGANGTIFDHMSHAFHIDSGMRNSLIIGLAKERRLEMMGGWLCLVKRLGS